MPFNKLANAELIDPILNLQDWEKMHGNHAFRGCAIDGDHPFCKTASNQKEAASSKYLLSHATIMASCAVEKPPHDFLIRPTSAFAVNNNFDAWSNAVLKLSYKSFIGAFNFLEHYQNSKKGTKGHILDSVLRKVEVGAEPDDWVYYCDILVATDLSHEQLVADIRSGKVKHMSMGCVTDIVICSFCGTWVTDQNAYCRHLQYDKGLLLEDEDGVPRKVAELCGHSSLPNGGVKFVEASFVATPAFEGATVRNIISEEWTGPKSKYTKSANGLLKTASISDIAEILLSGDPSGDYF